MWSTSTWPARLGAAAVVLAVSVIPCVAVAGQDATISVIYPRQGQSVGAVDSSFILGHVPAAQDDWSYAVSVNGLPAAVHPSGGFLAFVPLAPGAFEFCLHAELQHRKGKPFGEYAKWARHKHRPILPQHLWDTVGVQVPEPVAPLPVDSLAILPDYAPRPDLTLAEGDILEVSFQGTPGCAAWFSIDGVVDSVPMAEVAPRSQAYWGEALFGGGAVPESLLIRGIYSGFWTVPAAARSDTASVRFHLAPPVLKRMLEVESKTCGDIPSMNPLQLLRLMHTPPIDTLSRIRVTLNSPAFPTAVRFTDSVQIVRHGPRRGYLSIFQPRGVEALAVGAEGDWLKLRLSATQVGWVNRASVELLPKGTVPPQSLLRAVRMYAREDRLRIAFPLQGKHPFRVEETGRRELSLRLFGVTSDTDWIRYDLDDTLIDLAAWSQPEPGLYEFRVFLTGDLWGYDTYYEGNTFYLEIMRPPEKLDDLEGKVIVIDPGHSKDPGAIGPTGLTEAEANLGIALELRRQLEDKGAQVVMTRVDTAHVELYERPAIARRAEADLFVSIHNNSLPDGVNPFHNHGVSTYYYHPHSIDLARAIQRRLLEKTRLGDFGLYHGNLAVARPTQYPSVLVECAFMILPEHEALLRTQRFRETIAEAVRRGIEDFLEERGDG